MENYLISLNQWRQFSLLINFKHYTYPLHWFPRSCPAGLITFGQDWAWFLTEVVTLLRTSLVVLAPGCWDTVAAAAGASACSAWLPSWESVLASELRRPSVALRPCTLRLGAATCAAGCSVVAPKLLSRSLFRSAMAELVLWLLRALPESSRKSASVKWQKVGLGL